MKVTYHAEDRIMQRIGVKKRSIEKIVENAYKFGIDRCKTHGNLNRYLMKLHHYDEDDNIIKVYNEKIYIFKNETLITVLSLPHNLCTTANKLQKKYSEIKGEN